MFKIGSIINHAFLLVISFIMVFPLLWMIISSFKPSIEIINTDFHLLPEKWTFENYIKIFDELPIGTAYLNSILVCTVVTFFVLLTSSLGGYLFSKLEFKGRDFLFMIVLGSIMVPPQIIIIPLFLLIVWLLGLSDSYIGIVLPFIINAFGIFLLRQNIKSIPNDYLDAARIEGASEFQILFLVVIPFVKYTLAILGVLVYLWTLDELLWPLLVINSNEMKTLPLVLSHFTMAEGAYPGESLAASSIIIVPVILIYLFCQRYFIKGMTTSGIK